MSGSVSGSCPAGKGRPGVEPTCPDTGCLHFSLYFLARDSRCTQATSSVIFGTPPLRVERALRANQNSSHSEIFSFMTFYTTLGLSSRLISLFTYQAMGQGQNETAKRPRFTLRCAAPGTVAGKARPHGREPLPDTKAFPRILPSHCRGVKGGRKKIAVPSTKKEHIRARHPSRHRRHARGLPCVFAVA